MNDSIRLGKAKTDIEVYRKLSTGLRVLAPTLADVAQGRISSVDMNSSQAVVMTTA